MRILPEVDRPFRLKGKDLTFFKMEKSDSHVEGMRVMIYFRFEDIWHYPQKNSMETVIWNRLEEHGFYYAENELEESKLEMLKKMESMIGN